MRKTRVALALSLAVLTSAPVALAQKGTKTTSDSGGAAAPTSSPATDAAVGVGTSGEKGEAAPPRETGDATDVAEKPGKTYYFIGLRYGGTIIPKFMINAFVDGGGTFYSNTFGAEVDIRKDGFSMIPSLTYSEYGTGGNVLFKEKNKPDVESNWSIVNSDLKAIYLGADLLWSAPISKNVDFEYGVGFGVGVIFGDLVNNWVSQVGAGTPGALQSPTNGAYYALCQAATNNGNGCDPRSHTNPNPPHVVSPANPNGYTEPSWANGGSKPNVFPRILLHLAGVRVKPTKWIEGRLGIGFSLTEGFWFGLSADYGLERPEKKAGTTSSTQGPVLHW